MTTQKTLNILKLKPNKTYRVVKGSSTLWIGAEVKLKELNEKEIVTAVKHGQQLVQLVQLGSESKSKTGSWYCTYAIEVIKSSPEHDSPTVGVYFGVGTRLKFVEVE